MKTSYTSYKSYLRLLCLLPLALATACAAEQAAPADEQEGATGTAASEMTFRLVAASLTRAASDGIYGGYNPDPMPYPVENLFLTTYHRDRLGITQWYFQDIMLTEQKEGTDRLWKAHEWYWPIQGEMEFLSYWSPKVYGSPEFYEYHHADGHTSAQMVVHAQGVDKGGERYEGLDGYTDFLYIALNNVDCPKTEPYGLTYKHGLAWITVSLQGYVPKKDGSGDIDEAETARLIEDVKVRKIVLEDVSRKGTAYLVPGKRVAWTIEPEHVMDQVYTRPAVTDYPRGTYAYFDWYEVADGASATVSDYLTLSPTEQHLGLYTPKEPGQYAGDGLLLVPQHKTALTVYYRIKNGKKYFDDFGVEHYEDLDVAERYELRDNDEEWDPGKHYHYHVRFTSSVDELDNKYEVEVVETTYEILRTPDNECYDAASFGQLVVRDSEGNTYEYKAPTFVLDPLHNSGSPFEDEMDYRDGGTVF